MPTYDFPKDLKGFRGLFRVGITLKAFWFEIILNLCKLTIVLH